MKKFNAIFFLFILTFNATKPMLAMESEAVKIQHNSILVIKATAFSVKDSSILFTSTDSIQTKHFNKQKLLSAICAFPFPLGFVGAHRILLGTKPWVPIVYVATFGGCFGLLPLVDFCVLLLSDDIKEYENNPSVFMWVK